MASNGGKTYVVEHLDEELGPWSELEYIAIAEETQAAGGKFCLSSLPPAFRAPDSLKSISSFTSETRSVEDIYVDGKARVCLLDPAASKDLSPDDGDTFDVFLFGGILGMLSLSNPPCVQMLMEWQEMIPQEVMLPVFIFSYII
jgi:ribosome biogenesis SPOUT family RNA methylase Rps3